MAAGAAAPEAAGIDLTIGLWLVAAVMLGIAAERLWNYTFGALLHSIANAGKVSVWKIKINLGGPADAINSAMTRALGKWLLANEQALGKWWHAQVKVVEYLADTIYELNKASYDTFHSLVFGTIPRVAGEAVAPVKTIAGQAKTQVKVVERTVTLRVYRVARAQAHALEQDFGRAWRGIDAIRTKELPRIWRHVHGVEADVAGLERQVGRVIPHRLTRLEKWLGAGVIGGAAVAALTRVFPYWQCSNVKRFNRNVCRSPLGSLDWLFALGAATIFALNLEEVAHEGQDVANGFAYLWDQIKAQGT